MFYFDKNFGLFWGELKENKFHKHYALQLSFSTHSDLKLSFKNNVELVGKAFFINSKTEHKLICDSAQLTILLNPLSSIGYHFHTHFLSSEYSLFHSPFSDVLMSLLLKFESKEISFEVFCRLTSEHLSNFNRDEKFISQHTDERILRSLAYMDDHFERVLSVEEVSEHCNLSPTRFLHLFKEKTNLNFRRYQLWNKVIKSLPFLTKNPITETALTFGFSDSSHYTRTFIETFGLNPKFFNHPK